jgi:hypothetical protein
LHARAAALELAALHCTVATKEFRYLITLRTARSERE